MPDQPYVSRWTHVEFDDGYAVFNLSDHHQLEVWRRSTDQMNPETSLPCVSQPSQLRAYPEMSDPQSPTTGNISTTSAPSRGVYVPFALLEIPAACRAFLLLHSHFTGSIPSRLSSTSGTSPRLNLWKRSIFFHLDSRQSGHQRNLLRGSLG